jgi:predicted GNAT family N-acyltransferase
MIFGQINFGSEEYHQECRLRNEVLRAPLGLNLFDEDLGPEQAQAHFGLFDQAGALIACVIVVPLSSTEAKLRQMAVSPGHQRQGHGRRILRSVEEHLAPTGIKRISMHARVTAVGFYSALGYATEGHQFIEVGIPHIQIQKALSSIASERSPGGLTRHP